MPIQQPSEESCFVLCRGGYELCGRFYQVSPMIHSPMSSWHKCSLLWGQKKLSVHMPRTVWFATLWTGTQLYALRLQSTSTTANSVVPYYVTCCDGSTLCFLLASPSHFCKTYTQHGPRFKLFNFISIYSIHSPTDVGSYQDTLRQNHA
jgi:hypothetical protein